jgi:uncharacterized membrane protein
MRLKNIDLIGAIGLAAINIGWQLIPGRPLAIGIVLGLPLVFVLPGYTLTQVLFRRQPAPEPSNNLILPPSSKIGQPIGTVDYIILSLGLSLAIDVLVGFTLNVLPMGLRGQTWTIALGSLSTLFALCAIYRRRNGPLNSGRIPRPRITTYQSILMGLAILLAIGAVWFSITRPPATQADFTQFWMLPSKQFSNNCAIQIGMQSNESTPVTYRIVLKINDIQVNTWPSMVLAPQEKWEQTVTIKAEAAAFIGAEAQLYRTDEPNSIYRDVHLTIHTKRAGKVGQEEHSCS